MIRFAKFWSAKRKITVGNSFRCKSFLVELLMANRLDSGISFSNYPDALEDFFAYIVRTRLSSKSSSLTTSRPVTFLTEDRMRSKFSTQ